MSHISIENHGAQAKFDMGADQKPYIEFLDPSYARANAVLLNVEAQTIHTVLHEGIFLIGEAPKDFFEILMESSEVELCADLYSGDHISLHAPICLLEDRDLNNVVKINTDDFPSFAAGGYAMTALA